MELPSTTTNPAAHCAGGASPGAPGQPGVPRNAAEAKQMAQQFLMQLQEAGNAVGAEPTEDGQQGEEAGGANDLGMGDQTSSMMQGLMGLTPGSLAAAQASGGAGCSMGDMAATGSGQAAAAAGGLNAPVASAAGATSGSAKANAMIVADAARKAGVDPRLAVAMMLVESGGNNRAVGDGGTSFGLFQLHEGGMLTAAGLTPAQAFDPATNAGVAMRALAHEQAKGPNRSPGVIAAASQRPGDAAGYAAKVNATLGRAEALLQG